MLGCRRRCKCRLHIHTDTATDTDQAMKEARGPHVSQDCGEVILCSVGPTVDPYMLAVHGLVRSLVVLRCHENSGLIGLLTAFEITDLVSHGGSVAAWSGPWGDLGI